MKTILRLLLFFPLFLPFLLHAQTQTIRGAVLDQQSESPLIGATVQVLNTDAQVSEAVLGAMTDVDGNFLLKNVPVGRQVLRYSGGRNDVAKLVANFASVAANNDARNDIIIRGNSPTGVLWRLEGIPIPNPNHYSTLGTTGGPVSALNPNIFAMRYNTVRKEIGRIDQIGFFPDLLYRVEF